MEESRPGRTTAPPPSKTPPPYNPCLLVRKRRIIFQPLLIPLRIPLWILRPAAKQYRQRFVRLIDRLFISLCALLATDDVSILNAGRFVFIFETRSLVLLKLFWNNSTAGLVFYCDIRYEISSTSLKLENASSSFRWLAEFSLPGRWNSDWHDKFNVHNLSSSVEGIFS